MARARRESAGAVAFQRAVSGFVGRASEIARVRELIDGEVLFLVYGVAGVGKSELVFKIFEELAADARWGGLGRLHVEVPAGRGVADLIALIRAQLAGRGPARDVQVPAGSGDDRAQLAALLDSRPHLILVDDAHNLPGAELGELLDFIARHVQRSRVFVASRAKIEAPAAGMIPIELRLGPLSDEDAGLMIAQLAGRLGMEIDRAQIDEISRRAKGSPFFLRRCLVESESAAATGPGSLEESLAALDRSGRELLLVAAALRSVDAGKLEPEELVTDLSRRFLLDIKRGQAVVHDLVAEALSRVATDAELRDSQNAAADLLLGPGAAPLEIVRAVDCLCAAGAYARAWEVIERGFGAIAAAGLDFLLADNLRVIGERAAPGASTASPRSGNAVSRPAGSPASGGLCPTMGEVVTDGVGRHLGFAPRLLRCRILLRSWLINQAAESAAELESDPAAVHSYDLWYLLGEIAQRTGDLGRALECFERALSLTEDPGETIRADLQIAWLAALYGEGDHARRLIENASADQLRTAWLVSASHLLDDNYHIAADLAIAARAALDDAGRDDLAVRIAMLEILSLVESYRVVEARAVLDERIEPAARSGMIRENTAALYRGAVLHGEGRTAEALGALEIAWAHTQEHRDALNSCIAGYFLAAVLIAAGRSRDAYEVAARADEAARAGQLDSLRCNGLLRRAEAAVAAGLLDRAEQACLTALELPKISAWGRAQILAVRARARAYQGKLEAANKALGAAVAAAEASEQRAPMVRVELAAAEIALLSGQFEQAAERAERARELLRGCTRPRVLALAFALEAVARAGSGGEGDRVVAAECIKSGAALAERGGFRDVKVLLTLASCVLERLDGDRDNGRERMRETLRELALESGVARQLLLSALGNAEAGPPGLATLVANLGFGSDLRYRLIDRHGRRPVSDEDAEAERRRRDIWVDAESGLMVVDAGGHVIKGRPITARLMAALVEAEGGVVAAETLYKQVWEAPEYHPLRHRNTLYVAINRLRKTLRELLPGREAVETGASGWRLADDIDACSVKRLED